MASELRRKVFVCLIAILITIIIVLANTFAKCDDSIQEDELAAWKEYKRRFNKTYSDPADDQRRLQVFIDNKRYVDSHNIKINLASFTQGLNSLSDLTTEEVNESRNGFRARTDTNLDSLLSAANSNGQISIQKLLATLLTRLDETASVMRARFQAARPPQMTKRIGGTLPLPVTTAKPAAALTSTTTTTPTATTTDSTPTANTSNASFQFASSSSSSPSARNNLTDVTGRRLEGGSRADAAAAATQQGSDEELLSASTLGEHFWGGFENLFTRAQLDYRDSGRVSRVKDQGSCGSCWAFATTGAIEAILAGHNKSVLLSEQNLVDCSRSYHNLGCAGGLMDQALRYVRDHGIMSAKDYPYTARDGTCMFKREKSVTRITGSIMLPRGNEALLRIALALTGPIPVAIDAGARSFHSYRSGVYDDPVCRSSSLNHAVLLIGYGTAKNGGDYWLIKNSWGRSWGENGYMRLARNRRNLCGVASYAVLPIW